MRRTDVTVVGFISILLIAASPIRSEELEAQPKQGHASEISIATLNALKLVEARISNFGETTLHGRTDLNPLPSDTAGPHHMQGVRFGLVTMYPPEQSILVTIEKAGQEPPMLRVQQGFGVPRPGGRNWGPAPVSQVRKLSVDEYVVLMSRFEDFGICDYPIDNNYGNDGSWSFMEFLDGDRYCFAVRWGSKSEELRDFGEALILDLGIRDK